MLAREDERSADRRMSGHRKLSAGREDAHAPVVARIVRGKDEGRLRKVELFGDGLHRLRLDAATVRENGQRVSAERAVCKHVNAVVVESSHVSSFEGKG